jgi:hypothetical protein
MGIERIDSFITAITNISDETAIHALCLEEMSYLRQEYNVTDTSNDKGVYSGLATYKRAITNYRKAVYLKNVNHIALSFLKLSDNDKTNFSKQNEHASFRNFNNADVWNKHVITDTVGFIETSVKLLDASSYIDNILGLAALTGRRIGEIGYYSDFEMIEQNEFDNEYRNFNLSCEGIKVNGLSKKQTYKMEDKTVSAIIPVLYDSKTIYDKFNQFRNSKTFDSHEQFHNRANKELSKKVKKHYSEYLGECTCHDLRKAYARITFDHLASLPDEAISILISKILCQSIPANYLKFSSS